MISFIGPLLIGALAGASGSGPGGELSVQVAISSKRPYLGDTVTYQITVKQSSEKPPDLDTRALENIGARSADAPSRGHSVTSINGVTTEQFTFTYSFQFVARTRGPLTIPSVILRSGKEMAETPEFDIEVVGPEPQEWMVVEIVPSDRTIYPGQTVSLFLDVYLRRLTHDGKLLDENPFGGREPPHLKVPWLGGTEILERSKDVDTQLKQRASENGAGFVINDLFQRSNLFSLFEERGGSQAAIRFDRAAVDRAGADGEKVAYYRYRLPLEYRGVRSGDVGPLVIQLRGTVYTGVRRGARGLEAETRELFAISTPVTLTILPVPKAGQPDTFTGGVGKFKASASAQPTSVRIGDPITLVVRVTGTGALEELGPPNLAVQPNWSSNFKIHDDPTPGRIDEGAKTFSLSVRPKSADIKELPAIRISYFDPKLQKYMDTYTDLIPLKVVETSRLDPSEILSSVPRDEGAHGLEELAGGLAANYAGLDVLQPDGPYRLSLVSWTTIAAAPALGWIGLLMIQTRSARRRRCPGLVRAQSAAVQARKRLDAAERSDLADLPNELARILAHYIADRLDIPAGELTPAEARCHAQSLGLPAKITDDLASIIEECEQARFARSGVGTDLQELTEAARGLINRIEQTAPVGRSIGRSLKEPIGLLVVTSALVGWMGDSRVSWASESGDPRAILERANAAFERGARETVAPQAELAFREAIAAYRELVESGVENGKLYYNLANAYFRVGDAPRSILYFRLAERLRPRDELVRQNLRTAQSHIADRVELTETHRLVKQLLFLHYAWSERERTQVAWALLAVAWIMLGTRIWVARRWLVLCGTICLAIAGSLTCSVILQEASECEQPLGVLIASDVVVRKGDGATYEPQFNRSLGAGIEIRRLEQRGDWVRIRLPDGKSGWVRSDQVEIELGAQRASRRQA